MGDKSKIVVKKLLSDGSNWVTYCDHMTWSLQSRGLLDHLNHTTITPRYVAIGNINNITPQMQWEADEAIAMQVIVASVPNSVFTNIKGHNTAKDVWDTLKALYKGHTTMVLVNLSQQLQSQHCRDDENVCEHFDKLTNLCKQLGVMGKSIPDNKYASILMGSLPSTYYGMLGAIAASTEMSRAAVSPAIVIKLATDEFDH